MFYVTRSPSPTHLLTHFLESFTAANPEDPFSKKWIIVQNKDVANILSIEECKTLGISANNEYIFPSELIWKLYRIKNPEIPQKLKFDLIPLQWSIYSVLEKQNQLLHQITGKNDLEELVLVQLAGQIADVFDLYQVYRPDMIMSWQNGSFECLPEHLYWQAILWNEVRKDLSSQEDSPLSRAEVFTQLKQWLLSGDFPISQLPNKLWIYRLPQMSRPFVELLNLLSQHIDIHFYNDIQNQHDEAELKSYHEFLTKPNLDTDSLVDEIISPLQKTVINASEIDDTTLSNIQSICNGKYPKPTHGDRSFSVHSCHSIRREVEVLRDTILYELENDESLHTEDILILVPNLKEYASIVGPILEGAEHDVSLPVSNIYQNGNEQIVNAFIQLLGLLGSKFKANDFIEFLDLEIVRSKWALTDDHIQQLREWVNQLNIRRGIEGDVFSWREGIDRLLLGYCMADSKYLETFDLSAFTINNQNEAVHLLATISNILNQIIAFKQRVTQPNSLTKWINIFKEIAINLIVTSSNDDLNTQSLLVSLDDLNDYSELSVFNEKVNFFTVLTWLKGTLKSSYAAQTASGNGIKIGEYVPNRRNPHKFVALLGLNETTFPRKIVRPDFDLIYQSPKKGDRVQLEEDRHIFYDLIQNAGQTLFISYIGQDLYSENKKAPSILLDQLIDIARNNGIEVPITEHKLHGFSPTYFTGSTKSFNSLKKKICERLLNEGTNSVSFTDTFTPDLEFNNELTLGELIQFYTHSSKYICTKLLGINYFEEFEMIENRPPFKLDQLDRYQIRTELIEDRFDTSVQRLTMKELHSRAVLPDGYPGEIEYENALGVLELYKEVLNQYPLQEEQEIECNVEINDTLIQCSIDQVYPTARLELLVSSLKGKHLIKAWIKHLVLNTQVNKPTVIYFIEKDEIKSVLLNAVENASTILDNLINTYKVAIQNPESYFLPTETAYKFASTLSNKDQSAAIKDAQKQWEGGSREFSFNIESEDRYHALLVDDDNFYSSTKFMNLIQSIWLPIINHLVTK